jgi:TolA-binding protein
MPGDFAQHRSGEASGQSESRINAASTEAPNRSSGEEAEKRETNEAAERAADEPMRRAEELVDRIGARVGEITAMLGHQLLRLGARVREEAEDIWAEAQNLRRGQRR